MRSGGGGLSGRTTIDTALRAKIQAEIEAGISTTAEIARKLNVSDATVRKYATRRAPANG